MKTLKEVLKVDPYPYQKKGITAAIKHHYIIIGDEQGLGKSLQAIAISALYEETTLVVCPAFLKLNWLNEINKFCSIPKKALVINTAKDIKDLENYDIVIMSYGMLKYAELVFPWASIIISDEAHYLKNIKAKRTLAFIEAISDYVPDRLIMLTGTPIDKHVIEFYTLMYLCSFNLRGTSGQDISEIFNTQYSFNDYFSRRYTRKIKQKHRTVTKIEWRGIRNLDNLKRLLKGKFLRRKASSVLDLPDLIEKEVILNSNMEYERELNEELEKFKAGVKLSSTTKSHSAYLKAKFTAKYVKELLEEVDDYAVIFTEHILPIQVLYNELNPYFPCKVITGDVDPNKRDEIVNKLQSGEIRLLILTIGAGSTGFNMTRANHIIFNDKSWKQSLNDQAIKRIHRIGQKNKCIVHNLICSPVDKKIDLLLKEKQRNTNHLL